MNNSDMLKIGIAILLFIIVVVVILVMRKKDNYQYPAGALYAPSSTQPGANQKGNGGVNIPTSTNVALVADQSGNINTVAAVPIGGIIMWAGSIASIPVGWGLCNGSTYNTLNSGPLVSPDLTSKFVLGAGTSINASPSLYVTPYGVGDTGGEDYHQLTIPEMPNHFHQAFINNVNLSNSYAPDNNTPPSVESIGGNWGNGGQGQAKPNVTGAGGDPNNKYATLPHNNMPPYYALAYIIKYL